MDINIINEQNGNPFEYFPDDTDVLDKERIWSYFPRSYKKQESVRKVMNGLLAKIGLGTNIDCLEVGAGHNPNPSQSLSGLGARVTTLDANWEPESHTNITLDDYVKLEELGKELLIPRIGGKRGNVTCYLGDVAFLRDEKSDLRNQKFDLVYFWGSLNTEGMCSSIDVSSAAEERVNIHISFSDRLLPILPTLKDGGRIVATKSHFSGYLSESESDVGIHNSDLLELALFYALNRQKRAKSIGIFVQSPEAVMRTLSITKFQPKPKERLFEDPFERTMGNGWYSLFGKDNDYQNLRNALRVINFIDREKFSNLGLIDAVCVEY